MNCSTYNIPSIAIVELTTELLSASGPDATSIGSPNVDDYAKEYSVWDEVKQLNHKEESYEDKVHE